jgi:hypothetical protein
MRIVRYELEIVDFQQLQPLWPGHILSVGAHRYNSDGTELPRALYAIDIWCLDDDPNRPKSGDPDDQPPVLGVWIVGTGNPMPQDLMYNGADFRGTVDMRPHASAWHVFTAIMGHAETIDDTTIAADTPEAAVEAMAQRHRDRRGI